MLIDVFEKPERYRFSIVGRQINERYGTAIAGKFADEIEARNPIEYLRSQGSATVERGAPTYFQCISDADAETRGSHSYVRMLFPMWGEGHIGMLMGAISWI
ncbi:MAG TPA: hypothetical protein VEU47_09455 [Candidatus Cybelea sp.]|nr:hypothetical protein [Candidatus Cybelea sp.]